MCALFQHGGLEIRTWRRYSNMRFSNCWNRASMYDSAPFACRNMAPMYDSRATDAGILPRCAIRHPSRAGILPRCSTAERAMLECCAYVRLGAARVLEYRADARFLVGTCRNNVLIHDPLRFTCWNVELMHDQERLLCWNNVPTHDFGTTDTGMRHRCTTWRPWRAGLRPQCSASWSRRWSRQPARKGS